MNNLEKLRQHNPLVICYTNDVVKHFTANGLLSIGASPAMSEAPEEASEFLAAAGALVINIGTLTKQSAKDMLEIAKIANEENTPIVFDPVAVGASQFRKSFCQQFLEEVDVTVIKGNASEILTLIDSKTTMKGTDSNTTLDVVTIAKKAQQLLQTTIVITGETDVIAHEGKILKLTNGTAMLTRITGAGCLLGGIIASFVNKQLEPKIDDIAEAVTIYNIAAEHAAQVADGPGSFLTQFIDALYNVTYDDYLTQRQVKEV
ncbi:hydroxyethylthiazole kinase [Staphylococcus arlettae]|uniref:hydroxyethylthiazole kinase n=1 Tax=Staphylococcus arlettae TaxID=29378 RepID=UPI0011334D50|nr:hydroxyethylthiazole kinase [Staphylococcus arlettae]MCD9055464.1 hydroxyethylthiazole kinase [Staphylococcus arlettae]BBK27673.1 hydroxyethylthiazole kinase [Staphylococcus arlettae]